MRLRRRRTAAAGPDKGESVPYHPPIADYKKFNQVVPVVDDSMIDLENTDVNLNDWYVQDRNGKKTTVLTVDAGPLRHFALGPKEISRQESNRTWLVGADHTGSPAEGASLKGLWHRACGRNSGRRS